MNLSDCLAPLDSILTRCQIRYVVIGAYAVAAWGEERATRDIDLLCGAADSRNILRELEREGLHFEHRIGDFDDPISEVIRIEINPISDPVEVDLLIGIRHAPPDIFARARVLQIEQLSIPVASPEDMIILKLLGGSVRDLEDAKSIVEIQGNRMDLNLVRKLCPVTTRNALEQLLQP
jgi:hypothetical protein